jgi:putative ABC transport system permease protein
MNFLQRALKNTTRKKTKTILLVMTFFLIGNLVIIGQGVKLASENAKTLTRQKMKPVVSYELDYDAFNKAYEKMTEEEKRNFVLRLGLDKMLTIAKDPLVEAANITMDRSYFAEGFESLKPINDPNTPWPEPGPIKTLGSEISSDKMMPPWIPEYRQPDVRIIANMHPKLIEMANGDYVIQEGRWYTQEEIDEGKPVVIVEQELAAFNNLKVGDSITIKMYDLQYYQNILTEDDVMMDFEIVGIYKNNRVLDPSQPDYEWKSRDRLQQPGNLLLVNGGALANREFEVNKKLNNAYNPGGEYQPVKDDLFYVSIYLLKDPLKIEEFKTNNTVNMNRFTKLNANDSVFQTFAKPLDSISFFAAIVVTIVIVNAIVIISLITALTLKMREYELGVLLAMGVPRNKVVMQLFAELLLITVIGFTLASVSGSLISTKIGNVVLEYQVTNSALDIKEGGQYWSPAQEYFTNITQEDMLSQYKVAVSPLLIVQIYGLGLIVVLISTIIPGLMIMRYEPKRIMTNTY